LAASEPDDDGAEWLALADCTRLPARPTSLAHLGRRASEKKLPEARSWCERRHLNRGYMLWKNGKPDPTPARAEKRTASRFYQLKSGHALTGVYLKSTDNRLGDHCWWCNPENDWGTHQTRDHLSKHCGRWKDQQAESGAWVTFWRMRGAAQQCSTSCGPPMSGERRGGGGGGGGGDG